MAGYSARQSTYTDGDVINAADSNDEFNQVLAAFNNSTGHNHDGTAGEGSRVTVVGTAADNVTFGAALTPDADNTIDIGTSGAQFKDLYINGTANIDLVVADVSLNIAGDGATVTGIKDEDDMSSNSATKLATQQSIKAYVDAQVTAQDLDFQADTGGALNIDLDSESLTFTGGTGIDTSGSGNAVTFAIDSTVATLAGSQTLTNKTIDVDNNTVSNIEVDNLKSGVLDTDLSSVAGTDTTLASAKAIKAYVDSQVTAQDLDFQGDSGGALSIDLDSETLDIAGGTGIDTAGSGNTLTVNIDSTVATLTGSQTLTNKTLTSAVLNGTISGTSIKDEDNMASDSATHLATQQSIKAYVDTQVATVPVGDITSVVAGAGMTGGGTSGDVTLNVIGGTGITANADEITIDATVATLSGSQTLTNKSIDASQLTGTVANARLDQQLQDVAGLAVSDGNIIVGDGANFVAESGATARTSLGVSIGSDVQAYDAGLASIAGLTTAANKVIYTTGSDTYAVTDFTAFGRSLVDDADAAAARTTLGLGTAATSASTDFDAAGQSVVMAIALG